MALRLLYRNEITTAASDSATENNDLYLIDGIRTNVWVDASKTQTVVTVRFGDNVSSPGDQHLISSLAIVHNLPLTTTVTCDLYDGIVTPANKVGIMGSLMLAPSFAAEGVYHPSQLDANGHIKRWNRQDHCFIYHFNTKIVATDGVITFNYPSSINPEIRHIYLGDSLTTQKCILKDSSSFNQDASTRERNRDGNQYPQINGIRVGRELTWPKLTSDEVILLNEIGNYVGTSRDVILDLFPNDNDLRAYTNRIWGLLDEPITIEMRPDYQEYISSASTLMMEH